MNKQDTKNNDDDKIEMNSKRRDLNILEKKIELENKNDSCCGSSVDKRLLG